MGILAALYGSNSGRSPVRNWGGGSGQTRPVFVDGKWFTVSTYRTQERPSRTGFRMQVQTEDKKTVLLDRWYPWDVLDKVKFELQGGEDV